MRVCPLSMVGNHGQEVINCMEEICMFWVFEKDCCALLLYLTSELIYEPTEKDESKEYA